MEKKEMLFTFLKKHRAYRKYIRNLKLIRQTPTSVDEYTDLTEPKGLLIQAFKWVETPEGFKYWNDLESEWHKHIK